MPFFISFSLSHRSLSRSLLLITLSSLTSSTSLHTLLTIFNTPHVIVSNQVGCRLIIYQDDLLILHQGRDRLQQMVLPISQLFKSLGLMVNHKKIYTNTYPASGVLGIQHQLPVDVTITSSTEDEENTAGCQSITGSAVSISPMDSPVCGQDNSYLSSPTNSSSALQSTAVSDELSCSSQLYSGRVNRQVQHHGTTRPRELN